MQTQDDITPERDASILAGLLQNIPGMVYRGNANWSIEIMRGCEQLCGYTPAEVSAMEGGWLALVHDEDRDSVTREGAAIREQPRSIVQEYRIVTKSGELCWVEDRKTSFFEDGQFAGVDGILFDITERRRALQELAAAKDKLIAQQSRALQELSTPVIQVWDGVLILPLIGTVDTRRGHQITESLLESIVDTQASVAIIDITGVPVVDTLVAGHFINAVRAARLLGADVILTGVSPYNAQALVKLGVDLSQISTQGSLKSGLRMAIEMAGNHTGLARRKSK